MNLTDGTKKLKEFKHAVLDAEKLGNYTKLRKIRQQESLDKVYNKEIKN